jgi:hypothetical protein
MATQNTPKRGIALPVPGSGEPFSTSAVNAAFTNLDTWSGTVDTALSQVGESSAALEAGLAAGTKPVAAAGVTGALPVAHGGTGGTTVTTAREGLRMYVQGTQPTSPQLGDMWFWHTAV